MNVSGFSDDNHSTIAASRSNIDFTRPINPTLYYVTYIAVYSLGIPGNILSAIVWLRRRVASKNSSAVYLAALAINDLAVLLLHLLSYVSIFNCSGGWLCLPHKYLLKSAAVLEPLLVLGFSVERLIAILLPLQVCCTYRSILFLHGVCKLREYMYTVNHKHVTFYF